LILHITYKKESCLSVANFCSANRNSVSWFYLNKQRCVKENNLVEVDVIHPVSEQVTPVTSSVQTITLSNQVGELSFPQTISYEFLVNVIKGWP
jgi:hypothetical protein